VSRDHHFKIAPSLLAADLARLGDEVAAACAAGVDLIHLDVMDNHHVPNLTFGPHICAAIRPHASVPIEAHLMCKPVDALIPQFATAGADIITIHPESVDHLDRSLALIREQGAKAGLAINPATPLTVLDHVMSRLDLILLMSVNPGFGGQTFISETLNKIEAARARIDAHVAGGGANVLLEVDGGVKPQNIREIAARGCDAFVVGSAFFSARNARGYRDVVERLRSELAVAAHERSAA
jgi:ribulose-phosphate 3-epimerase